MKIAIHGPMCSGKTTVANIIKDLESRFTVYSFGQKVKDIAYELFSMEGKDRTLLIKIADKMREIDKDVWAKYVINLTNQNNYCIIDDLRFQNELNYLDEWQIICLTTPEEERIRRIKNIYKSNYEDHIKNMAHISENDALKLPDNTIYIDTNIPMEDLRSLLITSLKLE